MKTSKVLAFLGLVLIATVASLGIFELGIMEAGSGLGLSIAALIPMWVKDGLFNELSIEDYEKLSEEDKTAYAVALQEFKNEKDRTIAKEILELQKDAEANADKIEELKTKLNGVSSKDFADLMTAVKTIGSELKRMKEEGTINNKTFKATLKTAFDSKFEDLKNLKEGKNVKMRIETKATATYGDITNGSDYALMRPGVIDIPVRMPKIRSLFSMIPIGTQVYKWPEQETVIRDAQNVAKCAAVVSTTKETIIVRSMETEIVKDMMDFCRHFVSDFPFMESRITKLINESVSLRVDEQLLKGTGVAPQLNSIDSYSSEFSATNVVANVALKIQDANYVDLIKSMQTQIIELGKQDSFDPNVVLVNKVDWFLLVESFKDANNNYLDSRVTMVNGMPFVGGMQVVWSTIVDQNTCFVMDTTKAETLDRQELVVDISFENKDNWEKELGTIKAYERLNLWCPVNWQNAFMKCSDVATGITAIKKP